MQVQDLINSSTPDGMAPLDNTGFLIFIATLAGLPMLWGLANLALLLRTQPDSEANQQSERVFELSRKMLRGSFDMAKFTCGVSFLATLIFFLVIMGAVEHFKQFQISIAYLLGSLNSIMILAVSAVLSNMTLTRVIKLAKFSLTDAFDAAKKSANFQTFFFLTWTVFGLSIWTVLYERRNMEALKNPKQIVRLVKTLVGFTFGAVTVAIGCRICNSIYSKGAEMAIDNLYVTENRLARNHKHPALIIKALGQNFNKVISNLLDSLVYLLAGIVLTIYAAAENVIGTDQKGEIIFELSLRNCYLPILSYLFSLIFLFLFNVAAGVILRPSSGEEVRRHFLLQKYAVLVFLCGFQSLASYLALPAEFVIKEIGISSLRHPYQAYLCILFGLLIYMIMGVGSELVTTLPALVEIIANSCSTGSATNIIYGLSFGYMTNFIPYVFIAGTLFLCNYWLGTFGVGLVCVGYLSLITLTVSSSITYSYLENASYLSYISNQDETTTQNLITAAQYRKDNEPHMLSYHYGLIVFLGFVLCSQFMSSSMATFEYSTSLKSPTIFLGLILGAMYPYFTAACLIRSIHRSYLAIAFDLRAQIDGIPSMAQGSIDADFVRTNALFCIQCVLSLKRFFLLLFYPMLVLGIGIGPQSVLGFLAGSIISTAQLGLSSMMSGSVWNSAKKEIGVGNVRDADDNAVKPDSEWGRAADVGNQVGVQMKDCVATGVHMMTMYAGLMSLCLAPMYSSIHKK